MIYSEIFEDCFKDVLKIHKVVEFDYSALVTTISKIKEMKLEDKDCNKMSNELVDEIILLCAIHQVEPTLAEREHLINAALQVCDWVRKRRFKCT